MALRDMIRAVRDYPIVQADLETAHSDLKTAQTELKQTKQALEKSDETCESLWQESNEQQEYINFLSHKAEAVQSALMEFCPKLSAPEEMKRFYDMISPNMDASGSTLYRVAKELTEIDVPSLFPYEDNRGLFETMDGHQLMDWLTAVRFDAVDWTGIPGSTYESAELREVDTSTPEYRAFEGELYKKVLERMGFQDILAPSQEVITIENNLTELKLYSPLRAELEQTEEPVREWVDEPEPPSLQVLDGDDLSAPVFRDAILHGIEDEQMPEEEQRGLMTYFYGSDAVNEKVVSVFPSVEEIGDKLYGVAVCQVRETLNPGELAELKEFCAGQYGDGWGEGYEQRPRRTEYGDLYVSFWQDKGFFILTKEEMETAKAPNRTPHQPKRGGEAR